MYVSILVPPTDFTIDSFVKCVNHNRVRLRTVRVDLLNSITIVDPNAPMMRLRDASHSDLDDARSFDALPPTIMTVISIGDCLNRMADYERRPDVITAIISPFARNQSNCSGLTLDLQQLSYQLAAAHRVSPEFVQDLLCGRLLSALRSVPVSGLPGIPLNDTLMMVAQLGLLWCLADVQVVCTRGYASLWRWCRGLLARNDSTPQRVRTMVAPARDDARDLGRACELFRVGSTGQLTSSQQMCQAKLLTKYKRKIAHAQSGLSKPLPTCPIAARHRIAPLMAAIQPHVCRAKTRLERQTKRNHLMRSYLMTASRRLSPLASTMMVIARLLQVWPTILGTVKSMHATVLANPHHAVGPQLLPFIDEPPEGGRYYHLVGACRAAFLCDPCHMNSSTIAEQIMAKRPTSERYAAMRGDDQQRAPFTHRVTTPVYDASIAAVGACDRTGRKSWTAARQWFRKQGPRRPAGPELDALQRVDVLLDWRLSR